MSLNLNSKAPYGITKLNGVILQLKCIKKSVGDDMTDSSLLKTINLL